MYTEFIKKHINIPFYAGLQTDKLGMDSKEHSANPRIFAQWAPVTYQFNEIGFRTHSANQMKSDAILVLGDSFTLGLGVNVSDRYTDILEKQLSHQVLNFSLNGASNDWIARTLPKLLTLFCPRAVVIHYTFSHRRERPHPEWHDDERTECEPFYSSAENFDNWMTNFNLICGAAGGTKLIHSFIPDWHDQGVDYDKLGKNIISPMPMLDRARDNFHYGVRTHQALATAITNLLDYE
jgi:hypothetical protein